MRTSLKSSNRKTLTKNLSYTLTGVDIAKGNGVDVKPPLEVNVELLCSNRNLNTRIEFLIAAQIAVNGEPDKLFSILDEQTGEKLKVRITLHKDSGRYNYLVERPAKYVSGGSHEAPQEVIDAANKPPQPEAAASY